MVVDRASSLRSAFGAGLVYCLVVALLVVLGGLLYFLFGDWLELPKLPLKVLLLRGLGIWLVLCLFCPVYLKAWKALAVGQAVQETGDAEPEEEAASTSSKADQALGVREHLRDAFGFFWRRHVRVLLVVGEPDEIDAVAPGLANAQWQEGQGTLLLWGGSLKGEWESPWPNSLRQLSWRRPLDGIVWAMTGEQAGNVEQLVGGVRHLQGMARTLRWRAPLYLWQVRRSSWEQVGRVSQSAGCLLPSPVTAQHIESTLRQLVMPLRERGLEQLNQSRSHDFLLRLARDLEFNGITQWRDALMPLLPSFARGVPLRGLLFGAPRKPAAESTRKNSWWPSADWDFIREDRQVRAGSLGWTWLRGARVAALCLAGLCALAVLLSFASNRAQIATVETALATIGQPGNPDAQLTALSELAREIARLDYRRAHGVPWYQRFGMSQNDALLASLWPRYAQANNRLMRDVAAKHLEQQLTELAALPADSPERASRAEEAHAQLKAYLMMARPEKADAAFLTKVLTESEPARPGVAPGLWQGVSPNLWAFYAQHLAAHPEWRITAQPALVAQARQVLLGQLGQRNGVANLYQQVLDQAGNNYAAMSLMEMVGETDASSLFDTPNTVPGVFTRQAWEGQVRKAIDEVAEARREEIDWVLSDQQSSIDRELKPEVLKAQLTELYFQDFSGAWLAFLNSIRWRQASNLSDAISQLTLLSDVRQSPLIALMNTLAYQGKTEVKGEALADSLMKSAQQLLEKDKQPAIDQKSAEPRGPLDSTFGPLLALLGKDKGAAANGDDSLSLQAFLTRVTRVRLKLQQVTNASDPQVATQALAQTVFQGKSIDLTDTLDYGDLIAASLGAEWSGFGQNIFVQPLSQAWEGVLQPSSQSLNRQWQRAVVTNWNQAFNGRYPFAATGSDASLPMLGQMIRAESGRIDQFISTQLSGVLHKEGNRWVPDSANTQGLHFNPQFLKAVNQLGELADILYTDGGMGMTFQLQAKPVRNVVETTLILDGVPLEYFNQMESWQHFTWPGGTDHPGASLSWTSIKAGARLFGDYSGTWGLIRLLEQAKVTTLDDSNTRFELVLTAPDKLPLTWQMRTELGNGPLALLQLRGFKLPANIFDVRGGQAAPYAVADSWE
ncbi:ImcF-related family protein [Pseudomonas sp. SCB32]|uniref:ImcF-related family protein n=1 Tax=Pseudomonas sp. SCB32 TaxID=2653853 RepID=UPI0012640ADE|nr:ImcF-related family protein [Pseudomonas sp. SCB32]